jgi:hypothetical protein
MSEDKKKLTLKEAMELAKSERLDEPEAPLAESEEKVTPFNQEPKAEEELVKKKPNISIQEIMQLKKSLKNGTPVDHARALTKFKKDQIKKSGS